jgi:hypothetical protein
MTNLTTRSVFGLLGLFGLVGLFTLGCGSNTATTPNPGAAGSAGTTGGGTAGTTGTGGSATGTGGANPIVVTPEGTLFMDDFESGAAKWTFTQGTCSVIVDGADGGTDVTNSNVLNCINGGNEARALAGQVGWGEYSVQAKVKVNAMDAGRRIYLAGRFTDSSNWYGAAIYNGTPYEVEVRKKVAGTSTTIAHVPYAIELGKWYTLKLEVKGSTLRLFVNGVIQIEITDPQFASGQIALLVDRSDVSWDEVTVTNP